MFFVDAQLHLLQAIQSLASSTLDHLFLGITMVGDERFYLLLVSLLYWNVSPKCGYRLALVFLLGALINGGLKELADTTRPCLAFPEQIRLVPGAQATAGGNAFPSGHAQSTTTVYGGLWMVLRRPWLLALAIAVVAVVSFSRLYLGVHWPQDVIGGMLIGLCLLCVAGIVWRAWDEVAPSVPYRARLVAATAAPLALFAVAHDLPDVPRACGVLLGLGAGHVWAGRLSEGLGATSAAVRAIGSLFGVLVVAALYLGGGRLLPKSVCSDLLLFTLIGLWLPVLALVTRYFPGTNAPADARASGEQT